MIIVYESKTGFTKRYADMLSHATGMRAVPATELGKMGVREDIIFLGWMKVGKVQGLHKARGHNVRAVCGSGTGRAAEPDEQTVVARNKIEGIPFFYLRGGCKPLREIKGMDRTMLSLFVKMLKRRVQDEQTAEAISIVENGFDGVKEENLAPVLQWLKENRHIEG